ncbi:unnamed protein product, partial [Prorocentrum cordatum]
VGARHREGLRLPRAHPTEGARAVGPQQPDALLPGASRRARRRPEPGRGGRAAWAGNAFLCSARHLEGLQQVLRRRALEEQSAGVPRAAPLPPEVIKVIDSGYYGDRFLKDFDGKTFPISSEEVIPGHEYCLALEVHSGGAYWSHLPASDESSGNNNKVETVSASSSSEGSAGMLSHYGAAQRGAVFVWRWRRLPQLEGENLPGWLVKALSGETNDPLRKLQSELEAVRRWQQRAVLDTALHTKKGAEVKDPYIREVLRLWPCHGEQGGELKTCAWVEGLDPKLFIGKNVAVARLSYDEDHTFVLHAVMSKRHSEEEPDGSNPPYTLKTTWRRRPAGVPAGLGPRRQGPGRGPHGTRAPAAGPRQRLRGALAVRRLRWRLRGSVRGRGLARNARPSKGGRRPLQRIRSPSPRGLGPLLPLLVAPRRAAAPFCAPPPLDAWPAPGAAGCEFEGGRGAARPAWAPRAVYNCSRRRLPLNPLEFPRLFPPPHRPWASWQEHTCLKSQFRAFRLRPPPVSSLPSVSSPRPSCLVCSGPHDWAASSSGAPPSIARSERTAALPRSSEEDTAPVPLPLPLCPRFGPPGGRPSSSPRGFWKKLPVRELRSSCVAGRVLFWLPPGLAR